MKSIYHRELASIFCEHGRDFRMSTYQIVLLLGRYPGAESTFYGINLLGLMLGIPVAEEEYPIVQGNY